MVWTTPKIVSLAVQKTLSGTNTGTESNCQAQNGNSLVGTCS